MLRISKERARADTDVLEACHHTLGDRGHGRGRLTCSQDPNKRFIQQRLLRPGTPWGGRAVASRTFTPLLRVARDRTGTQTRPRPWGQQGCGGVWLAAQREHAGLPAPVLESRGGLSGLGQSGALGQRRHIVISAPKSFQGMSTYNIHSEMCPV